MARRLAQLQKRKISTPEAFDALVRKIEIVAQRNPAYYRRRLRWLASLGYVYIAIVFALLFGGLWLVFGLIVAAGNPEIFYQFGMVALLLAIGFASLFFVWVKPPKGVELKRAQVPLLFEMLDNLSLKLQAPKLNRVILNDDLNAGIMQLPKLGFIGWQTNILVVGLPLMQALSPQQLEAVMAHELAHLCGGDGKVGAWIYRIRRTWYDLAERFERGGGGFLFKRFFSWYGPFFKAYSFVHARSQEYEADRRAAEIVGAQHKAEALIWLGVNSSRLSEEFYPAFRRQTMDSSEPPDDFVTQMMVALASSIAPARVKDWLALRLVQQTDNASTHPCLSERLGALGYEIPDVLVQSDERATSLLGDYAGALTEELDRLWKKEISVGWKMSYGAGQRLRDRLDYLNSKANSLTIEERIKRALLVRQLDENAKILPIFQEIAAEAPNNTKVRYWLGRLLSEQQNKDCISHLEFVIDKDPSLLVSACRSAYSLYLNQAQPALAEPYKQRWQQHENVWNLVLAERAKLNDKASFVPHDLPSEEVRQLGDYFATLDEIGAVYVVRCEAARFGDHAFYVIAIARRFYQGMGQNYKPDPQLEQLIRSEMALSQDYALRFINQTEQWAQLKQVKGALIYQYSSPA